MASWYLIMNKNAKYLYSLEVMPPPTRIGHFFVYNPIAWQLRETLRKVTFVNRGNIDPESIVESDAGLVLRAEHFIQLTEIRVELLEPMCHIPELELVLDHIPTTVEFVVFATSFTLLNIDASKLQFPEVDTTTIKPLPHVERLRGLHCYFCDDNAIKYITHKFPNVDEFIYTILDDPWNFYARFNLPDTPNQLSPSVQTMYFEYFMKMSTFDVFLVFAKEELPSLMSRWMAVANSTIPEESVSLTLINNGFVEPNCSYVRWKKLGWPRSFEIIINFNDTLPWTYGLYIGSIGRCLENIALEYLEINSEILSQIYEGCPVLNHLLFDGVTIPNAIDTGEITSKLKEMTFSNIGNSSSQHISSITKSLPDLFSLFLYDVDLVVPKEEMTEDNSFPYKDLEFDISSTCAYQIRYAATYDFVPPWCIFVNDDRLLVNQDAFKEGPYRQLIFMEEASPEDFKVLEERIAPSKRNYRYCMRIKCKLLHCFNFSKNSEELPDNRDNDALAQDDITFLLKLVAVVKVYTISGDDGSDFVTLVKTSFKDRCEPV
ncbi:unnamed protein product [Mucor hiemalis]